ncbi:MAG: hypothetical protein ACJAYU_003975 [Bradymonadia bacterium]|jgi:hypothetical protein
MVRLLCKQIVLAAWFASGAFATEGWVELPGSDIEFPDDSEWDFLPNGALKDDNSGVVAIPLLMLEDGIPANRSEREILANRIAGTMQPGFEEDYEDVAHDTVLRDDGFAILMSGYAPSALHGGERAMTLVTIVATSSWVGAMTLIVPQSELVEQAERVDAIARSWRRTGARPSAWDSQQIFSMESPLGFVPDGRIGSVSNLVRYSDGARLVVVSSHLGPRSARGRIGIAAIVSGLASIEGLDVDGVSEEASENGMLYELQQVAQRPEQNREIEVFLRLVETPDVSAGFLLYCNDGLCDGELESFDLAFETFEWR